MTARRFIQKLLEECENLDRMIDFYVTAEQDTIKAIIDDYGIIDHFLEMDSLDNDGRTLHVILEKIEY